MKSRSTTAFSLLAPIAGALLFVATGAPASAASPIGCLIEPEQVADVGSPVIGVVDTIRVDRGHSVRRGEALVMLKSDLERAGVQVTEAAGARIEADINGAIANVSLAEQRYERATKLQAQGFVSTQVTDQARAEFEVAVQRLEQARGQKQVWGEERNVAITQLGLRVVRSPFDGVIVERFVNPGERVEEKALVRLARLNPLRVEVVVPASLYGTIALNEAMTVHPELPGVRPVTARVSHVDKVIDAASNTFRVRLVLPNPGNQLPAGSRCKVDIGQSASAAPRGGPASPGGDQPTPTLERTSGLRAVPDSAREASAPARDLVTAARLQKSAYTASMK